MTLVGNCLLEWHTNVRTTISAPLTYTKNLNRRWKLGSEPRLDFLEHAHRLFTSARIPCTKEPACGQQALGVFHAQVGQALGPNSLKRAGIGGTVTERFDQVDAGFR